MVTCMPGLAQKLALSEVLRHLLGVSWEGNPSRYEREKLFSCSSVVVDPVKS
jgi:hypothetical protein